MHQGCKITAESFGHLSCSTPSYVNGKSTCSHIAKRRSRLLHNDRRVAGCTAEPVPDGASPWPKSVELLSHLVSADHGKRIVSLGGGRHRRCRCMECDERPCPIQWKDARLAGNARRSTDRAGDFRI